MKCDQYGTAEEAEQASAEGISQQTARKLVSLKQEQRQILFQTQQY